MANMYEAYGDRMAPAPIWTKLGAMRESGGESGFKLVLKSRKGSKQINPVVRSLADQLTTQSGKTGERRSISRKAIVERLVFPIINEAAVCLAEGVATRPADVDLAMVFGTGFAPFRGGPLNYADAHGVQRVLESLEAFSKDRPWLTPSDALRKIAQSGEGFHGTESDRQRLNSPVSLPMKGSRNEASDQQRSAAVGAQPVPQETLDALNGESRSN